jgi:hypothetical protein
MAKRNQNRDFNPHRSLFTPVTTTTASDHQQSMLQPLASTNHRLNSCILDPYRSVNQNLSVKKPERGKRVTFSKEGIPVPFPFSARLFSPHIKRNSPVFAFCCVIRENG